MSNSGATKARLVMNKLLDTDGEYTGTELYKRISNLPKTGNTYKVLGNALSKFKKMYASERVRRARASTANMPCAAPFVCDDAPCACGSGAHR